MKNYLKYLVVAIITFLLFSNTLNHQYVYDDYPFIVNNQFVQQGIAGIPSIFSSSYWDGNENLHNVEYTSYRPIPAASFAIEQALFGDKPFPKHLIQVLLYVILVVLVFVFVQLIFKHELKYFALLVSLLFASHPLHSEIVSNLKSRDELLALLFFVLSLLSAFYSFDKKKLVFSIISAICFLLAIMCKESILILLPAFPLLWFCFGKKDIKNSIINTIPHFINVLVFFILKYLATGAVGISSKVSAIDNPFVLNESLVHKLTSSAYTLGLLFLKLIFPSSLQYDYSYGEIVPGLNNIATALFGFLIVGLTLFVLYKSFRSNKTIFWILAMFLASIALLSNVLLLNVSAFAERFLFVPSFFYCLLLGGCFYFAGNYLFKKVKHQKLFVQFSLGLIILLFSIKTFSRNSVWKNNEQLFSNDILLADKSVRANFHYANLLVDKSKQSKTDENRTQLLNKAEKHLQKAENILPKDLSFMELYLKKARVFELQNKYKAALETYQFCLQQQGDKTQVYNNLGKYYIRQQNFDEAKIAFEKVIDLNPDFADAYSNLSGIYGRQNDLQKAISLSKKAISLSPTHVNAYKNLVEAYKLSGDEKNYLYHLNKLNKLKRK